MIFFMLTSHKHYRAGKGAALLNLNNCSHERLFNNGARLSRLFLPKKSPLP
jgi:hypothetical protein